MTTLVYISNVESTESVAYQKRERVLEEARRLLAEGEQTAALGVLDPYLRKYRQDADANILAGVARAQLGKPEVAEMHFKEALAVYEHNYEVSVMLLRVLMDQAKWEEALPLAQSLRREYPNDRVVKVSLESILDHVERPAVGWERDENKPKVDVEFTNGR